MDLLITGGSGFLGTRLVAALSQKGVVDVGGDSHPLRRITILDRRPPPVDTPNNVDYLPGDLLDSSAIADLLQEEEEEESLLVFHLASLMSSDCEHDPELAYATNVHGTVKLVSLLRASRRSRCSFVMASSVAAASPLHSAGGSPTSVYGATKRMVEEWLAVPRVRAGITCVTVRLPTVIIRDAAPNGAASSYLSVAAREARTQKRVRIPVSPEHEMLVSSPRVAIQSLLVAASLPESAIPPDGLVSAPGITTTAREVVAEVARLAGHRSPVSIECEHTLTTAAIISGWPATWGHVSEATVLNQVLSDDIATIVAAYLREAAVIGQARTTSAEV